MCCQLDEKKSAATFGLIKRSYLIDPANGLLHNDQLKLWCKVRKGWQLEMTYLSLPLPHR